MLLNFFCIIITNVHKTSKKIFSRVLCETENKMANFQSIKNICKKLGENNKPTYVVMSIAAVKGICRPTFTMMDKKEKPETKKYTALREGLTEAIAIPVYWACGEIAGKFGKYVVAKDMDKKIAKLEQEGKVYTQEAKDEMKTAAIKKGKTGLMFIGVCTAALFIIPAVCSAVIKPVMDAMGMKTPQKKQKETPKKLDIKEGTQDNVAKTPQIYQPIKQIEKNQVKNLYSPANSIGMKVGGV